LSIRSAAEGSFSLFVEKTDCISQLYWKKSHQIHGQHLPITMSLFEKITTPNGQEYEQPLGLFINGEVVPSSSGKTIASIDPAYELPSFTSRRKIVH